MLQAVTMANCDLPKEILLEIFSKLPTKFVGRCRTLSKSWNNQLSTAIFIKKHLITSQRTNQQESVALITEWNKLNIITSPTRNNEVFGRNNVRLPDEWVDVVGSCNGLVLLLEHGKDLLLVNPITLKQVTIRQKLEMCSSVMFGFGYDSCANDYKLVKLSSSRAKNFDEVDTTIVDVYSVRTNVWKRIGYPYDGLIPSRYRSEGGPLVNGAMHWFICRKYFRSCIAAFDLANEAFREIPMPPGFVGELGKGIIKIELSVLSRCLSIVVNFGKGATDVWILREYGVAASWVRFRIEADGKWDSIVATLCFVEDGELLCLNSTGYLVVCGLKGGANKKVILGEHDLFEHGMTFADSLVSPELLRL